MASLPSYTSNQVCTPLSAQHSVYSSSPTGVGLLRCTTSSPGIPRPIHRTIDSSSTMSHEHTIALLNVSRRASQNLRTRKKSSVWMDAL
eukprot:1802321-Pleurochrysis_carterae.AAC.1